MKIQKIFSDEYDDERLYSVLMSEEELYLFSKKDNDLKNQPVKSLSAGILLANGGWCVNDISDQLLQKSLKNENKTPESKELLEKLKGLKTIIKNIQKKQKKLVKVPWMHWILEIIQFLWMGLNQKLHWLMKWVTSKVRKERVNLEN